MTIKAIGKRPTHLLPLIAAAAALAVTATPVIAACCALCLPDPDCTILDTGLVDCPGACSAEKIPCGNITTAVCCNGLLRKCHCGTCIPSPCLAGVECQEAKV